PLPPITVPKKWHINGYIVGSVAFFDANFNGVLDPNEPWGFTDPTGAFNFQVPGELDTNGNGKVDDSEGQWVIEGGVDTTTGLPEAGTHIAPATWGVITPLTTLVSLLFSTHGMTVSDASNQVLLAMGLPPQLDLSSFDPVARTLAGDSGGP